MVWECRNWRWAFTQECVLYHNIDDKWYGSMETPGTFATFKIDMMVDRVLISALDVHIKTEGRKKS